MKLVFLIWLKMCFLVFLFYHLKKYYKLIAIDSKQQKLNVDLKAMQQNERDGITQMFSLPKKRKKLF